jgi:hypothetical protein
VPIVPHHIKQPAYRFHGASPVSNTITNGAKTREIARGSRRTIATIYQRINRFQPYSLFIERPFHRANEQLNAFIDKQRKRHPCTKKSTFHQKAIPLFDIKFTAIYEALTSNRRNTTKRTNCLP